MTELAFGDRVMMTFEGTIDGDGDLVLSDDPFVYLSHSTFENAKSIEVTEFEWRLNDYVIDASGDVYRRLPGDRWTLAWDHFVDELVPVRPLKLLVRDGKRWPS